MTVGELIAELQKLDPSLVVVTTDSEAADAYVVYTVRAGVGSVFHKILSGRRGAERVSWESKYGPFVEII